MTEQTRAALAAALDEWMESAAISTTAELAAALGPRWRSDPDHGLIGPGGALMRPTLGRMAYTVPGRVGLWNGATAGEVLLAWHEAGVPLPDAALLALAAASVPVRAETAAPGAGEGTAPRGVFPSRRSRPGVFPMVALRGFHEAAKEAPPAHGDLLLGYRVEHLPELWFGVGYRDYEPHTFWLGPRGCDPHYTRLNASQVVLWAPFEEPGCFDPARPEYVHPGVFWSDVLGDDAPFEDATHNCLRCDVYVHLMREAAAALTGEDKAARSTALAKLNRALKVAHLPQAALPPARPDCAACPTVRRMREALETARGHLRQIADSLGPVSWSDCEALCAAAEAIDGALPGDWRSLAPRVPPVGSAALAPPAPGAAEAGAEGTDEAPDGAEAWQDTALLLDAEAVDLRRALDDIRALCDRSGVKPRTGPPGSHPCWTTERVREVAEDCAALRARVAELEASLCTPGLDGDCGTCPRGAGILPGALVCDATAPYYLLRVLGVRDGRILVCGFEGQDGVPDAGSDGQCSQWLTPQGDTWTDDDGERVFRLVPAEVAEETAGAIVSRTMHDPEMTDGDAMARLVRSEKALAARVAELEGECNRGVEILHDAVAREIAKTAAADARCARLAAVVRAEDAVRALRLTDDGETCDRTRIALSVARAALQPGDVPEPGKDET